MTDPFVEPVTPQRVHGELRTRLRAELEALDQKKGEPDLAYAARLADVARAAVGEAEEPLQKAGALYRRADDSLLAAKNSGTQLQLLGARIAHGEPETAAATYADAADVAKAAGRDLTEGAATLTRLDAAVDQAAERLVVADEAFSRLRQHTSDQELWPQLPAELRPEELQARLNDAHEKISGARHEAVTAVAHVRNGSQDLERIGEKVTSLDRATVDAAGTALDEDLQDVRSRLGRDQDLLWHAAGVTESTRPNGTVLWDRFAIAAEADGAVREISGRLAEVTELTTEAHDLAAGLRPEDPDYAKNIAQVERLMARCDRNLDAGRMALDRLDLTPGNGEAKVRFAKELAEKQQETTAVGAAARQALEKTLDPELRSTRGRGLPPPGPRTNDAPTGPSTPRTDSGEQTLDLRRAAANSGYEPPFRS